MRMLAIHNRQSVGGFSGLEEFRVSPLRDGGGLQTEHGPERYRMTPEVARDHRHQPIGGKQFVASARPALLGIN